MSVEKNESKSSEDQGTDNVVVENATVEPVEAKKYSSLDLHYGKDKIGVEGYDQRSIHPSAFADAMHEANTAEEFEARKQGFKNVGGFFTGEEPTFEAELAKREKIKAEAQIDHYGKKMIGVEGYDQTKINPFAFAQAMYESTSPEEYESMKQGYINSGGTYRADETYESMLARRGDNKVVKVDQTPKDHYAKDMIGVEGYDQTLIHPSAFAEAMRDATTAEEYEKLKQGFKNVGGNVTDEDTFESELIRRSKKVSEIPQDLSGTTPTVETEATEKEFKIYLITLEQFNSLPDGTELYDALGRKVVKGIDKIDNDVRGADMAYGFKEDSVPAGIDVSKNTLYTINGPESDEQL